MRFNGILLRRRPWWEQFSRQNWEIGEFTARCPASLVEIILIFHATEKRKFQLKRISALRYSAFGICIRIRIRIRISYPNPKEKQNQNQSQDPNPKANKDGVEQFFLTDFPFICVN